MESNFQTSFNARNLEPKEIAEKFIISPSFERLKNNRHTVILGARGCGKTTLMKMLTLPALYNWDDINAEKFIKDISFYSIYIPTDISWTLRDSSFKTEQIPNNYTDIISKFAVNTNVFESLCETFKNILHYEIKDFDENQEIELCINLIERWKLKNSTVPKIEYVKEALKIRRDDVSQYIPKIIFNKDYSLLDKDFFLLDYKTSLSIVTDIFHRIFNPLKRKWALCFDELEFGPSWLKRELYTSLRSVDQKLLFKLSSSPILPNEVKEIFESDYGPSVANDFETINMWELQTEGDFQRKIVESLLKQAHGISDIDSYFGSNNRFSIDLTDEHSDGDDYLEKLRELIQKDDSFKNYLVNKGIDIDNPIPRENSNDKDTIFRKIKPLVYFRNYFLKENKNNKSNRKIIKKAIEPFSGLEVLLKITDGNPRWLIGLINSILSKSNSSKAELNIQYDEIIKVSERFINFINNTPINHKNPKSLTMEKFIDKIGYYFEKDLLGPVFNPEPSSTFIFDMPTNDYENLIDKGLLQGAFVLVDNKSDNYDFKINNKRYKLSYLYHPKYKLPLRKNRIVKLTTILNSHRKIDLFSSNED